MSATTSSSSPFRNLFRSNSTDAAAEAAAADDGNNDDKNQQMKVEVFPSAWKDRAAASASASNNNKKKKKKDNTGRGGGQQQPSKKQPLELIGAIDQGTSSTRFVAFLVSTGGSSSPGGGERGGSTVKVAAQAQVEHRQIFDGDNVGWHEHDPIELWRNVRRTIGGVVDGLCKELGGGGGSSSSVAAARQKFKFRAVGITNQRETTVAWNAETGRPYYNAIVWDDTRTQHIAHRIDAREDDARLIKNKTGLPLTSYFAGTKIKWLLENVPALRKDLQGGSDQRKNVRFGTVDTWILYQLTGQQQGPSSSSESGNTGGKFCTDVTNASRWLFLDIRTCQWDQQLVDAVCEPHSVPMGTSLPQICPSSHVFGEINTKCGLAQHFPAGVNDGVPIASILGDQQAALFGQTAFAAGEAKNTYGTGLFLMMNTGERAIPSTHGLLTTVAFQLGCGDDTRVRYALEGSVSHSGSTIQWLRDQLRLISDAPESETFAATTTDNGGLYFVPAFSGLFAPHWRSDARACIVGMTATHHRGHVCRAALEAAAYQTREVFDAIQADSNVQLKSIKVDGGGTANNLLMQFQADIVGVPVVKPQILETTSLGAAFAAGLAVGIFKDLEEIRHYWSVAKTYEPRMTDSDRRANWEGWNKAVARSLGWAIDEDDERLLTEGRHANDDDDTTHNDPDAFQDALDSMEEMLDSAAGGNNGTGVSSTWKWMISLIVASGGAAMLGFHFGRSRRT